MSKQVPAALQGSVNTLLNVMVRLRDPETGCPWDKVQTFDSIAPYTIEEAYEVADAIRLGDMVGLREELGDLLLQVVYHARMAEEAGIFTFDDVVQDITAKMISRHPHVFGEAEVVATPGDVNVLWDNLKTKEKTASGKVKDSILDDVPLALPAIMRAQKLQKRAARVGFEWENAVDVLDKLEEEIAELRQAIGSKDAKSIHEEIGDMMFCVVNFGRMLEVDCEQSLRDCNNKFTRRFNGIEKELKEKNKRLEDASLMEMEALWQAQKINEKA